MKIKIIDILNKIARGEEPPKKIIFKDEIYEYDEKDGDYRNKNYEGLFDYYEITSILNNEVIILETTITWQEKVKNMPAGYIDEVNKQDNIKKVHTYVLCNNDFQRKCDDGYNLCATEIINKAFREYSHKINEIIDKINCR